MEIPIIHHMQGALIEDAESRKLYRKGKLLGKVEKEVELHSQLKHRNIVRFYHYFQDQKYIYIVLEYCRHKSLAHILRARKLLTEPEVRYYMKQILHGVQFLHHHGIIHRDLKLSNFFIAKNMVVKIGDLGLATHRDLCEKNPGVICGTPNYLSPEVLAKDGHSFKSDIWALGCIMYTMLSGYSPFRAYSQKEMYYFIIEGFFPVPTYLSPNGKRLIVSLLANCPSNRPCIEDILASDFFTQGFTPKKLSATTCHTAPTFLLSINITRIFRKAAKVLYRGIFQRSFCSDFSEVEGSRKSIVMPMQSLMSLSADNTYEDESMRHCDISLTILRKGKMSSRSRTVFYRKLFATKEYIEGLLPESYGHINRPGTPRKLETMLERRYDYLPNSFEKRTIALEIVSRIQHQTDTTFNHMQIMQHWLDLKRLNMPQMRHFFKLHFPKQSKAAEETMLGDIIITLSKCLRSPVPGELDPTKQVNTPILWVTKWVDYSNKYGFGYQLSDDCTGVLMSDGTHVILSPYLQKVCYSTSLQEHITFPEWSLPCKLEAKMKILRFFSTYMQENILEGGDLRGEPNPCVITICLLHFLKTDQALLMLFNNGTLQVNFYHDRTKIILSKGKQGYILSFIDQYRQSFTVPLAVLQAGSPPHITQRMEYALSMLQNL